MNYMKRIGLVLILALSFGGSIAFSADDAAILLEEAIYTEETLGDLDEAARIYRQIADNAESGRGAAAQALYRLGRYYEGRGRGADAKETFERLAKQYPEQKELIFRIPGLAGSRLEVPQFLPAPWEDGEMLTYSFSDKDVIPTVSIKTATTDAILHWGRARRTDPADNSLMTFTQTFIAESVSKNGETTWQFHSITSPVRSALDFITVSAKDDTLMPVENRSSNATTDGFSVKNLPIQYNQNTVTVRRQGGMVTSVDLPSVYYDSSQIFFLIRCLPLRMGFETTLPIFNSSYGSGSMTMSNQRISVEGRETVVTPAGKFNAWKVAYGNKGVETYYWISDDSRRYPVKIQSSPTNESTDDLVLISKFKKDKPVVYENDDFLISLPSGWLFSNNFKRFANEGYNEQWTGIRFTDPEFDTSNDFTLIEYPSAKDAQLLLNETVDGLIAFNQEMHKTYHEIPGSREDITISGFPGIRFIAQFNPGYVSYSFVVAAGDKSVRCFFRTRNENFDRFKPVFDSIIESIKLK